MTDLDSRIRKYLTQEFSDPMEWACFAADHSEALIAVLDRLTNQPSHEDIRQAIAHALGIEEING